MTLSLENYKWKNRLILVFAPDIENDTFREQLSEFENRQEEITQRDLLIFKIYAGSDLESSQVEKFQSEFDVNPDEFCILLIGKDGTVKMRDNKVVSAETVFDIIDSMPMRQQEMQKNRFKG